MVKLCLRDMTQIEKPKSKILSINGHFHCNWRLFFCIFSGYFLVYSDFYQEFIDF